ncbi:MAG: dihydrolipoyl dehydrogenase [Deltaproteobacteria bacterium]|nr:dihydrolipoyl dehydrogenase [Deltaproteobacteria bacterium]
MGYDVVVIGSGPGGYIAAIRSAQLGMKVAIVERYPSLGGTCLNVGCIPSKALLDYSEKYYEAEKHFAGIGIAVSGLQVDFAKMIAQKRKVVQVTSKGIGFLMKKHAIDVHHGHGSLHDATHVRVEPTDGKTVVLETRHVIVATGSKPSSLPNIAIDKERVITSTGALALREVPAHLLIVGGGIIGVELGSVYSRLGAKVTMIEYLDAVIPTMDRTLGRELQKSLKKLGMVFHLGHTVTAVQRTGASVTLTAEKERTPMTVTGDYCLVAVGRRPYTEGLGLADVGIVVDRQGRIPVNDHLESAVKGVYAIGDVIRGAMLAHKAEEEGVCVAEHLAGEKPHVNYRLIPSVAYTWPEVASVGYTEEALKAEERPYKVGSFPFMALGRARASGDVEGLVKVLADHATDEILGVHIIGARAADLIGEAVVAMEFRAAAEDIARTCHAHPTYSEAFKEACLAATANRALNI